MENNPNPRFVIENHILVVELLNNDDIIKIPLLYVNNIESGEILGDIEINAVRDVNKFGNKTGIKTTCCTACTDGDFSPSSILTNSVSFHKAAR